MLQLVVLATGGAVLHTSSTHYTARWLSPLPGVVEGWPCDLFIRLYFNLLALLLKGVANEIFKLLAPLWNSKILSCYLKSRDEVWIFTSQSNKNRSYKNKEVINKERLWMTCINYSIWDVYKNVAPFEQRGSYVIILRMFLRGGRLVDLHWRMRAIRRVMYLCTFTGNSCIWEINWGLVVTVMEQYTWRSRKYWQVKAWYSSPTTCLSQKRHRRSGLGILEWRPNSISRQWFEHLNLSAWGRR